MTSCPPPWLALNRACPRLSQHRISADEVKLSGLKRRQQGVLPAFVPVAVRVTSGSGEVAERLNALVSKTSGRVSVPGVRISPSPPTRCTTSRPTQNKHYRPPEPRHANAPGAVSTGGVSSVAVRAAGAAANGQQPPQAIRADTRWCSRIGHRHHDLGRSRNSSRWQCKDRCSAQ